MVIRSQALMGAPGEVYVFSSWFSLLFCILGVASHHDFYMWFATPWLAVALLLGWLLDQARWALPIVLAPNTLMPELSYTEIRRARVYCTLAGISRIVAVGIYLAWVCHTLQVAATGATF